MHKTTRTRIGLAMLMLVFAAGESLAQTSSSSTVHKPVPVEQVEKAFEAEFAGTPVRGAHKRYRRLLHDQLWHLDDQGQIFNYAKANWDAYEQYRVLGYPAQLQGDWKPLGPFGDKNDDYLDPDGYNGLFGIGRVNSVYFESANVWYAVSAGGGLWRTLSAGIPAVPGEYPWQPVNDDMPVMALSDLVGIPGRSDTLWLLTGDGFGRSGGAAGLSLVKPGVGILMSPDSGRTWQTTSVAWDQPDREAGYKLIAVPGDPYTQMAATTTGLYRTTDGWQSSSLPLSGGAFCDLEFEPGNPAVVYAGAFGSLWKSTDTGATWTDISANAVTVSTWARTGIALSPANPNRVYLIIVDNNSNLGSIQVSNDGGNNFTVVTPAGFNLLGRPLDGSGTDGQGNYDLTLWVDPVDPNRVFVGGINLWESTDGGNNWTIRAEWTNDPPAYVHADVHNLKQAPNGTLVACTDGGLFTSANGIDWTARYDGMAISQFYHGYGVKARPDKDISEFGGGLQDNGSLANELPGPNDDIYTKVSGGDGFRAYRGTPRGTSTRYTSSQNGSLYRQADDFGGWGFSEITPDQVGSMPNGAWDTPFMPSDRDFKEVTAGYRWLYYTTDADDSGNWTEIQFNRPGGGYSGAGKVLQMDWSFSDANFFYFSFVDTGSNPPSDLWVCRNWVDGAASGIFSNCGCSNVPFDSIFPYSSGRGISDISVYDSRPKDIVISRPGYAAGSKVYRCSNTDSITDPAAWKNISYNLPNLPMLCVLNDYTGVYVGTDIGAFFLPDGDSVWVYFADGLPTVPVTELWRHDRPFFGHRLFASTFGRGLWMSTLGTPRRQTRWYVNDDATGANTGANWDNAFTDLQDALDAAQAFDTVLVAQGTYAPTGESGLPLGPSDDPLRDRSFTTRQPNVYVYGGFLGTEEGMDERPGDPLQYPTVLSGDLGIPGDSTDNAYHVLVFGGVNRDLVLDGFYIRGGQASSSSIYHRDGGGIYMSNGANANGAVGYPVFSRLVLEDNFAQQNGGGMYVEAETDVDAILYLDSLAFAHNRSNTRGGGLSLRADSLFSSLSAGRIQLDMRDCRFSRNHAFIGGGMSAAADRGGHITGRMNQWRSEYNTGVSGGGLCLEASDRTVIGLDLYRARFFADSATTRGGGLCVIDNDDGEVPLNLYQTVFEQCGSAEGGGLVWRRSNTEPVSWHIDSNSAFLNNRASLIGGGAYFNGVLGGNVRASLRKTRFVGNRSITVGGGVASTGSAVSMDLSQVRLVDNRAGTQGGAWYTSYQNDTADLTFRNVLIRDNHAENGGGLFLSANASGKGLFDFEQCTINANYAEQSAGGLYSAGSTADPAALNLRACSIDSNTAATDQGGGLQLLTTGFTLRESTIRYNQAEGNGGGIQSSNGFHSGTIAMELAQSQFIGNACTGEGAAVYANSNAPTVLDFAADSILFTSNRASGTGSTGGAVNLRGTSRGLARFSRTQFIDDSAATGGALYIFWSGSDSTSLELSTVDFAQNDASGDGGALWIRHGDGHADFTDVRFLDNTALGTFRGGGGVYANPFFSAGGRWTLDRCWFSGNTAPNADGGALYVDQFGAGDSLFLTLRNTLLAGNSADNGGAVFTTANSGNQFLLDLNFTTAYGNTATGGSGGVLNMAGGSGQANIRNSVLWANTAASGEDQLELSGGYTGLLDWSMWSGTLPGGFADGGNNTGGVPLFADSLDLLGSDGLAATDDDGLRPAPGALQTDAADPGSTVLVDLRNQPRPNGAASDIGAYEGGAAACSSATAPVNLSATIGPGSVGLSWDPIPQSVACNVQGRPLGAGGFANLKILGFEPSSATVPGNVLVPGLSYEWRVRCACSISPLDATPFSVLDTFAVPSARSGEALTMALFPNPAQEQVLWTVRAEHAVERVDWRLIDALGTEHHRGRSAWNTGANTLTLDLAGLAPGQYRLIWNAAGQHGDLPLVLVR